MEQWDPPNESSVISPIRADGSEFWTALSPPRHARSPSRFTTFSDANGLIYLDSLPQQPIMKGPSPKRKDPLADMLPSDWEQREKREKPEPEPVKETPQEPEPENQPPVIAQTQNQTPVSGNHLAVDMPWNSLSSRTKRTKIRQSQAKSKTKPANKYAASTSPAEHDTSTGSKSPTDGSALRRSPRISKLIAHQKLQTTTPPYSQSEVKKDSQVSKTGLVPPIPRKRKTQSQQSEMLETTSSDTHNKKTTELPVKPSKIQRIEQVCPVQANAAIEDNDASRPDVTNKKSQSPTEPNEGDCPHESRTQNDQQARNKLQTPNETEESVLFHHESVEKSKPASVQHPGVQGETPNSTHKRPQKTELQPIYRDQAIQAFASQTTSQDAFPAKTAVNIMRGTEQKQRPSPNQAPLVSEVAKQHPKPFSQDSVSLPPPKTIVPSHVAQAWEKLAQRGSQHQSLNLKPSQEAVPQVHPVHHGEDRHGVAHERSSSPLFMDQDPEYVDDPLHGEGPWPPRNVFRNGLGAFHHHNTASTLRKDQSHDPSPVLGFSQNSNLAYSVPHTSHHVNEIRGTPIQQPQSQGVASASSGRSRDTSPEEVWRRQTADDSTFAIVHKIGMMLHRALKPREEVVDDIVKDYVGNSMLLLEQMSICHQAEKRTTINNNKAATEALHSLFNTAYRDARDIEERLHSFDIPQTLTSARKPAFSQKMQMLNQLCDERLKTHIDQAPRPTTDSQAKAPKKGDLVELFKSELYEQIGHSDASSSKLQMIDAEADMFIERLRNDEICFPRKQSDSEHVGDMAKTNLPAMEHAPGLPVASKEKKPAPVGEVLAGNSQEPIEISSHYDSDSDYVD
ncbi:hypothetical protein B0T20DRAFT_34713 [Sordaria brevicollis]|uniref:Uncharacterized protein n=1 Tax=Sordaria brevicollis TaxID=83679 RepID=A0AAE0P9A6_SORBR|nr:hypothetical protein B0T20DRAFT_34713 [Sordaria brevicollis]